MPIYQLPDLTCITRFHHVKFNAIKELWEQQIRIQDKLLLLQINIEYIHNFISNSYKGHATHS
jgi:hypothetical protein